jgi:hypothetical protein
MATIDQVARAFINGQTAKCHNATTSGTEYKLHNTVIARKVDGGIEFNWGGFYTTTTASHMNAVIKAAYGCGAKRVSYAQARNSKATTFVY